MNLLLKGIFIICLFSISSLGLAVDKFLSDSPIFIDADKVEYQGQEPNARMIATGNVVATQDNQTISANFVEYNINKDLLLAEDQVKMLQREGYIINADKVILSDRLKFGSVNHFTILMPDKSTLKGEFAKKDSEIFTDITDGYYTSCKICEGKSPIWEITAKTATLNQKENSMSYTHPVFKFYGVPIFYSPYLSHYTSKAERKSGVLRPKQGGSSYLGVVLKVPYYFNLAPNYDLTLTPVFTTRRGEGLEAEQRYLGANGAVITKGSVASTRNYVYPPDSANLDPNFRYHLDSKADFKLPYNNYAGWKTKVTSDKSYLKDYKHGNEDFLTSKVYNTAYQEKGYYEVQALGFQNLRPKTSDNNNEMHQTPMVLPLFESNHKLHQFDDGSNYSFESNILKIDRYVGTETNRASIKNKLQKSIITDSGHKFNLFSSLRNDAYYYKNAALNNPNENYTGGVSRTIPEMGADWSYPLGSNFKNTKVVFEPLASSIVTPYTNYNRKIYNEDSPSNELNDANLFGESRYSGIDLVENTPRTSYGMKTSAYYKDILNSSFLFGQIYKNKPKNLITDKKEDRFSDYVGRLKLDFADKVITSYQFKVDKYNFSNKTNEATVTLKYGKAFISSDILYYKDDQQVGGVKNRREISLETGINDYKDFSFSVNARKDLSRKRDNPNLQNGLISMGTKIKYVNDCITYAATLDKDLTKNQDKKSSTEFWFDISLKNIN